MAEYTPYLNLKKPASNEFYNVEDFNDNADLIDAEMEQQADGIGALQQTVNAHLADEMPHQLKDITTNKIYKYGIKQQDGHLIFAYQEVV